MNKLLMLIPLMLSLNVTAQEDPCEHVQVTTSLIMNARQEGDL